ncbi:hypothetical protein ACM56N_27725, partial [Klebsiella sp. BA397-4A_EMB]
PRAINEEVGKRLLEEMAWYDNYLELGKTDRSANPSPAAAWRNGRRRTSLSRCRAVSASRSAWKSGSAMPR